MAGATRDEMRDPLLSVLAPDPRADRGRREIAVSPERVTIRRRLRGIDMRLTLPVASYRGIALCLRPRAPGESPLVYQLRLVHRDEDLTVLLDEAADDRDIVADWRLWARVLGRPALIERELGRYEASGLAGDIEAGRGLMRRRRPLKQRPKFLTRRRLGPPLSAMPCHSGEREIIARS